jgi:DNA mismatch repair ATPase MutS
MKLTPMLQQYMTTKEQYKDCILFFRLGDFYEMFYDDAVTASRVLDITLTKKTSVGDLKKRLCAEFLTTARTPISPSLSKTAIRLPSVNRRRIPS